MRGSTSCTDPQRLVDDYDALVGLIEHLMAVRLEAPLSLRMEHRFLEVCRMERLARRSYESAQAALH